MYYIKTYDSISPVGLGLYDPAKYAIDNPQASEDAIMVHSHPLHDAPRPKTLRAIVRVGAGVNTIPVEACTREGIVVFNTPGGNANAVKELVLGVMILGTRNVMEAANWVKTLQGQGVEPGNAVEKGKAVFRGPEIQGKTLGVIGVGAIGSRVARAAAALGMNVLGYDPYLSKKALEEIRPYAHMVKTAEEIYSQADYITVHVPLNDETRDYIGEKQIAQMKDGVRLINYARGPIVNDAAVVAALKAGKILQYSTDFPTQAQLDCEHVLATPHLGAGTPEADENCAVMAANQIMDFLENGNITNAVNLPDVVVPRSGEARISLFHRNVKGMLGHITNAVADAELNISNLANRSQGAYAYTLLDLDGPVTEALMDGLVALEGVIRIEAL